MKATHLNYRVTDLFTPTSRGELINTHIIENATEPKPDFGAMKLLLDAADEESERAGPQGEL